MSENDVPAHKLQSSCATLLACEPSQPVDVGQSQWQRIVFDVSPVAMKFLNIKASKLDKKCQQKSDNQLVLESRITQVYIHIYIYIFFFPPIFLRLVGGYRSLQA